MKTAGILLVILGIILGIIAISMDVSVNTPYGYGSEKVINIGLIDQRQNLIIFSGIAFISGILLIGFSSFGSTESDDDKKCPHCAEMIKREATICRYCSKEQSAESCISIEVKDKLTSENELEIEREITFSDFKRVIFLIIFVILSVTFIRVFTMFSR